LFAVEIAGLQKRFGDKVVLNVPELTIEPSTVTAVIGPNGAGKTTLLKIIAGLWAPTQAMRLEVSGTPTSARRRPFQASSVGLVADSGQLYGLLTVRENLEYMARLFRVPSSRRRERIAAAIQACGLESQVGQQAWQLSTGLKQRANIARVLVTRPKLLLLDEPTSGLDPISAQMVHDTILALRATGITILLCTHNMTEVSDLCDRVLFLVGGELVADGTPEGLVESVGSSVHTVLVRDGLLQQAVASLESVGLTRIAVRRSEEGVEILVFDCKDSSLLDGLGVNFSKRPVDLRDAFLVLAGDK
jgi:ABC-2 type transport system ATP-binding protein